MVWLINEMTEESKDSQEKVRELFVFTWRVFVILWLGPDWIGLQRLQLGVRTVKIKNNTD